MATDFPANSEQTIYEQLTLPISALDRDGRVINHHAPDEITFKGGMEALAHRWFRLTPSFSPILVQKILQEFAKQDTIVLDPFAGRGTTLIECQLQGIPSLGVEINPMLHFAAKVSLNWALAPAEARLTRDRIMKTARRLRSDLPSSDIQAALHRLGSALPPIHNVFRWWREDVLLALIILRETILRVSQTEDLRDFFLLSLANILVDAANITLGRLQFHFIDRSSHHIDPFALFEASSDAVCHDLDHLCRRPAQANARLVLGDSLNLASQYNGYPIDLVITSPPYPNRYSYVWNTRPHLYFLGIFSTSAEASSLDCKTIGGTWGTATSRHQKGLHEYSATEVGEVVGQLVDEIRCRDHLMANYVARYFDDIYRQIVEMKRTLSKGAICAYVVGNSRIKKCIVETDLLLTGLFERAKFEILRLEEIRRRHSGKELRETIVYSRSL